MIVVNVVAYDSRCLERTDCCLVFVAIDIVDALRNDVMELRDDFVAYADVHSSLVLIVDVEDAVVDAVEDAADVVGVVDAVAEAAVGFVQCDFGPVAANRIKIK